MNAPEALRVRDLVQKLAEAEATIEALVSGQIDAVVDPKSKTPVLLSKAQDALRESEERYRRIVETTNEGIWTVDTESNITFVNAPLAAMLGYSTAEMLGRSFSDFLLDAASVRAALRIDPTRDGIASESEVGFVRKDGSELWALLKTSPIRGTDGKHVATLIMMADQTGHRQSENALRASEVRFRRLAESGIVGIMIANVHGAILDANDAYMKMVGYSRDELVRDGLLWSDLTPPEFTHLTAHAVQQLQTSGMASAWETESFRKDGSRVPILMGVAMLEYPECIAFTADLTERKQAEAGRVRAEKALRQTEEQFRHAQKMEAVGRLAGGVAHDFNNILSVILSYGQMILIDLKPTDPLRDDIEEILKAGARATGLTRQLLTFSRQQVFEPKVMDLHEVLMSMDKMIKRLVGEDIELALPALEVHGRVKVDPSHVEQVILNLVVNARDAMPTGGKLTIGLANVVLDENYARSHVPMTAGAYVMISVNDTGTGMNKETQTRIFEPFFTTKEVGKGTGLGLSTVFGIVQQSGGTIWVDSEPGQGTTFKVYLPSVDAVVDVPKLPVAPITLRGTETILLVEDEEQVRTIVFSILRRHGYRVIAAESPGEALLLCEEHPEAIDLILTDVVMPQMSGPELAKRLTASRPLMKVLCMSGYTDDSIVRHGVVDTAVAFLQKPITPASLARKVREVLDAGSGHDEIKLS